MIVLALTALCSSVQAQDPVVSTSGSAFAYTFDQFGDETWSFMKQPGKWDGGDWLKIGALGLGTLLIRETADQPLREAALRHPDFAASAPMEFGRLWGDFYGPAVFFSGFAIHSLLTDDLSSRKIGYEIGQAAIYSVAITFLLKMAIGRARPYTGEGASSYHPFSSIFTVDNQSMPSGHNTMAFMLSTVLSRNAGPGWLKAAAFVPALLTFVSRVSQDKHWLSDDVAGAALGYFIATWVVDQHEQTDGSPGMTFVPPLSISIVF